MARLIKLIARARQSANNLSFDELCFIVEHIGFVFDRQKGSHRIYKGTSYDMPIVNIQNCDGKAKPYQVKQVLDMIDRYDLV